MDIDHPHMTSGAYAASSSRYYNPNVARELFEENGEYIEFGAGTKVFGEGTVGDKRGLFSLSKHNFMYFLAEGEVQLSVRGKRIDTIRPGGIFGEMAVISQDRKGPPVPRSATATATTTCMAYSLDTAGCERALFYAPEFALMIMSVMFERLRLLAARLAARPDSAEHHSKPGEAIFDEATIQQLQQHLDAHSTVKFAEGARIMEEGQPGKVMYIVLAGRISIAIGRKVVEKLTTGGAFGEMALVDNSSRTATAVARTDCSLLAFDRDALINLVKADPSIGMAMMRSVASRVRYMNELLGA
ncbi:MAG TPA: cyclic nucleotide-binding domain-containing protein [Usitatibacteraceae bacterium]|nr:cyclic nucleotide-binding domain-containing protein [Usitatibacteraceae bacterium]